MLEKIQTQPAAQRAHPTLYGWRSIMGIRFSPLFLNYVSLFCLILLPCPSISAQVAKAKNKLENQKLDRMDIIETRLNSIEARLTRIESALFATVRFSEAEAKKQLEAAKASLRNSETLYAKGLLSAFQMRIDRFNLERAQALHRMCVDHEDHRRIGATMEIFDAKRDLEQKRFKLNNSEAMFERGFLAKSQMEIDRKEISVAEKKLAAAQAKLKAMEESPGEKKNPTNNSSKKANEAGPKKHPTP